MNSVARIARELYGLFVDDAGFAVTTLAWLGASWLLRTYLPASRALLPYMLTAGLLILLARTILRAAKHASRRK